MKFENDHIRIIIEKKQLTEEQKEACRVRRKKRLPYAAVAIALVTAILAGALYAHSRKPTAEADLAAADVGEDATTEIKTDTGSEQETETAEADSGKNGEDEEAIEGVYVDSARLASSIIDKYKDQSPFGYTYGDPIEELKRDQNIELQLGYDAMSLENVDYWYQIYGIYQDPELTQRVQGSDYLWDEESKILSITPPSYSINKIGTGNLGTDVVNEYDHSKNFLFDKSDKEDWGNLGTLYLACYYDPQTGDKLETPTVSIITREGELSDTPRLSYSILEDGRPEFSWTPVEGAERYLICQVTYSREKGYGTTMFTLDSTTDTTWTTQAPEYGSYQSMNVEFKTFRVSEDDWKDETNYELYKDKYEPDQVAYKDTTYGEEGIVVIAISKDGTSMVSNSFLDSEIAPNLPQTIAYHAEKENGFQYQYEDVKELPAYDYVVMCDGITNRKLIDYHTEEAEVVTERFLETDGEGKLVNGTQVVCLNIPYVVEGTPFSYSMQILDYDESRLDEDLKFLEDRESGLRKKSGDVTPGVSTDMEDTSGEEADDVQVRQVEDTPIFASSALSEYLAASMLGGATYIDLSDFPEAKDLSYTDDALLEAYFQNPLILGIDGYRVNRKGTAIKVSYENSAVEQARKQEEIKAKVAEIIPQIITEKMTDDEKELAINKYLCDTIVYDEDALKNAEENNYEYVDERFNDSFTAYGALINGKCVCAGYSAAFKLLADAAGLESIVVTGFLDGSLSHAWNKVKIDDEWQIVDVTNNDNEYLSNALLNLPSYVGDRVLVEDKDFMIDKEIKNYTGSSEEYEYYHMTDSYFPAKEIARELAADLADDGEATLRTDYELNDEEFYQITDEIYEIMGSDIDLYGYYWIGVIYLTTQG